MVELSEFEGWLQKGLGRAVVYLKANDPKPLRETVLYACTHNLTYDAQCEGDREAYLLDLLHSCGDEEFFRNGLLRTLTVGRTEPERFDLGQTISVARSFAENGDSTMKRAMYEAISDAGFECAGDCYDDLIKMDGLSALLIAADHFPTAVSGSEDWLWQVGHLIYALRDRDGEKAANDAIRHAEAESPQLARMLEVSREFGHQIHHEDNTSRWPDYETVKRIIAEKPRIAHVRCVGWGKNASEADLHAAAVDLLLEKDQDRLLAYLSIFRFRTFPGPIARLLELAESANVRIARRAVAILSQLTNPEIRKLALRLLNIRNRQGDGVELLTSNFQQGDFVLIQSCLTEPMETDEIHHLEIGIRHLVKAHRQDEAEQCLLLLYEKGPCSLCRGAIVEELIAINRLPDWMRAECRYDSDVETRKLVE